MHKTEQRRRRRGLRGPLPILPPSRGTLPALPPPVCKCFLSPHCPERKAEAPWLSWDALCELVQSCHPHRAPVSSGASQVAQLVKNPPAMQETSVQFLGQEDPLEKGLGTHSSILGLPSWLRQQRIHLQCERPGFDPWVGKIPWRKV